MYEVLIYVHEHIREPLNLTDVAERFGYSKWHFCAKFHEYTGKSFVKYIRHFRLQLAAIDILAGRKILDVALDYGYEGVGGFNKAFLTEFGCYPKEYSKQAKSALSYYERRKLNMYSLTDRCELLRKLIMEGNDYEDRYCLQRTVHFDLGVAEAVGNGKSNMEAVAAGIVRTVERSLPVIMPGELIVGYHYPDSKYSEYMRLRDEPAFRELMGKNGVSEAEIEQYFAPRPGLRIIREADAGVPWTEQERMANDEWSAIGRCISSNHSVIGYERVLQLGFSGLMAEVEKYEALNGVNDLYAAMKSLCAAGCTMGEKYAREARRLLDSGDEAYAPDDLRRIIAVCSNVPCKPAASFHEAVQALWFAHILNTWEDHVNANSLGRLDQILYPYYKADVEKGVITKEEAFELICCLWLKLYLKYDVQQSCVGGTDAQGRSQVNDLSYMMLDATEQLDFIRCLSVRYSQQTEKAFIRRALEVVGHVKKGVPFFFNDDVMIPALESKGISHEDACDYTQIGCVETVIPGKSNPHAVSGETNLLKAIEYVLCNGGSMMYPDKHPGVETGSLEALETYEQFYGAVLRQVEHILDLSCSMINKNRLCEIVNAPKPFKSLLTKGCMESGRDFNDQGAQYDYYHVMLGGVPNLADSLAAIRKFVYEEKKYTLAQLKEILMADFPDEAVRQEFINKAPKFGNDIDSVDMIAVDIVDKACDMLEALSEKYGLSFHAQPFTYLWMVDQGRHSAASPDGRRKGEITAYSVSPMQGRDFNGLTAVFNSIAKLPTTRTPGTASAIVEVDPKLFTDRNIATLAEILLASSRKGLNNVQFNTIDADTLVDAKRHPEKYNNLAVRVSGFSQRFNLLSPELQDHIIGRTKHVCL